MIERQSADRNRNGDMLAQRDCLPPGNVCSWTDPVRRSRPLLIAAAADCWLRRPRCTSLVSFGAFRFRT